MVANPQEGTCKESKEEGKGTRCLYETDEQVSWEEEKDLEGFEPAARENRMDIQTTPCKAS